MALDVTVESQADFARWLDAQKRVRPSPRQLRSSSPATATSRPASAAAATISPAPRRAARSGRTSRISPAAGRSPPGTLPMNRGNLYGWVADPQAQKPGNHMPTIGLDARRAARSRRLSREAEMNAPRASATSGRARATGRTSRVPSSRAARSDLGAARRASSAGCRRVDHKEIGRRYIVTALVFLALGGAARAAHAPAAACSRTTT